MWYTPGMRGQRKRAAALGLAACLMAAGCGGGESSPAPAKTRKTTHTCTLQVSKKADGEFTATGSGEDPAKAEEAAWAEVCAKLPEAERASCRDEAKWAATKTSSSSTSGEATTHTTTLKLVPVAPSFDGEGTSEQSSDEACKAALAAACERAGAPRDCLAAGYEKKGEARTKRTVLQPE